MLLEEAAEQFLAVNHWRGLQNTYRHLEHLSDKLVISDIVSERSHINNETLEYKNLRQKYLDYFDFQRYNESMSEIQASLKNTRFIGEMNK